MMKKSVSIQYVILIFATLIAMAITLYIGSLAVDTSTFYWNTLLVNITFIGDAFFAFGFVFFLLFFFDKKTYALKLLIAVLISLVITQIIKNIFSGLPAQLYFEKGVIQNPTDIFFNRNVISSHVAIAFTLASFFVLHSKNVFLKIAVIVLAIFVGITRVSLAGDSLLALAVGLFPAIITLLYLYNFKRIKDAAKHGAYYYKTKKERKGNAVQQLLRV
jgi:PAP2 superfamily